MFVSKQNNKYVFLSPRLTTTINNKLFYQFQDTHPVENQYIILSLAKNNIAMKKSHNSHTLKEATNILFLFLKLKSKLKLDTKASRLVHQYSSAQLII